MDKAEERLKDQVAMKLYTALVAKQGDASTKNCAAVAWQMADEFMKARTNNKRDQYDHILNTFEGAIALRMVLELDGSRGQYLDWLVNRYAREPDPLSSYAAEMSRTRMSMGQLAILRFLGDKEKEKKARKRA